MSIFFVYLDWSFFCDTPLKVAALWPCAPSFRRLDQVVTAARDFSRRGKDFQHDRSDYAFIHHHVATTRTQFPVGPYLPGRPLTRRTSSHHAAGYDTHTHTRFTTSHSLLSHQRVLRSDAPPKLTAPIPFSRHHFSHSVSPLLSFGWQQMRSIHSWVYYWEHGFFFGRLNFYFSPWKEERTKER